MEKVLFNIWLYFKKTDMVLIAISLAASMYGFVFMVLPVIGISLPLFSSGGSSVTSCFFAVGIALPVHMHHSETLLMYKNL